MLKVWRQSKKGRLTMEIDLRARFMLRILMALIFLSLFWGVVIYFVQTRQIRNEVLFQGRKAAQELFEGQTFPFEKSNRAGFERLIAKINQYHYGFVIVRLEAYDVGKKPIFSYVNKQSADAARWRKKIPPDELFSGTKTGYLFHEFQDRIYLQIFATANDDNVPQGFFEVMVKVDEEWVKLMKADRLVGLLIVIGTIMTLGVVLYPLLSASYRKLQQIGRKLLMSNLYTIVALGNAIEQRDNETELHNFRVTYYSLGIAEQLKLPLEIIRTILKGSLLHDVGKIGVPDNILLKPGNLSEAEFAVMHKHSESGMQIIKDIPFLEDARDIILYHHEKFDGSGYPYGLAGEQIPLVARIFSVADVFDALASERPYKPSFSYEASIEMMKSNAAQFDSQVLQSFLKISEQMYKEMQHMTVKHMEAQLKERALRYFGL
jgi:HD-GYP domain-containing protein (c-di-GMP phosphodiesterase class II)